MFLNDYHIHSKFSGDSTEEMDKIIERAIKLQLEDIAITDHFEYDVIGMTEKWFINLEDYVKTVLEYKEKYRDKIDVKLGIEVGIQPHICDYIERKLKKYPFDFIIASTHSLDKQTIGVGELHKSTTKNELQRYYFETILKNVKKYNEFSVYGHIDFITRYGGEEFRGLNFKENLDIIDEIIKTLVAKNKGIEINTSGFRYLEDRFYPSTDFIKRYKELGGEIITVGSDSHNAYQITEDFDKVYDFLKSIGIKYICSFDQLKPIYKKLK